jgi:hypothetical protein
VEFINSANSKKTSTRYRPTHLFLVFVSVMFLLFYDVQAVPQACFFYRINNMESSYFVLECKAV